MNICQTVTDRILRQLDAGQVPWRKPWTTRLPKSLGTRREYRGVNILVLGTTSHTSRYWATSRQAQALGGRVRPGEKATSVVFWRGLTPEEQQRPWAQTGANVFAPYVPVAGAVFNLDQIEGIPRPEDDVPHRSQSRLEIADQMLDVMPDQPEIIHTVAHAPVYSVRQDRITLPHLSQFKSADEYYGALWHGLCHGAGHPRRLNRFPIPAATAPDSFELSSFEELVAEVGAAFLCAFTGIGNPASEALESGYIAGWAEALRRDPRLIVRAASAAQRAVDYLRGKLPPAPNAGRTRSLVSEAAVHA